MANQPESRYILSAEDRTRMAFESLKKNFESVEGSIIRLRNLTLGALGGAGLAEFARGVVDAGVKAEQSSNRLTAVLRATGDAAGFARAELDDMAHSLAAATQFDDKSFKNAEAQLLLFGNIYGDVFERALKISADLASFQGTDLASSIDAVGKALLNPIEGIKGLQAQVGKFSPAQREMIKNMVEANNAIGAQNKVLEILQGKIVGTAALMNTGYTKAISDTAKAWDKLKEALAGITLAKGETVTALDAIAGALRGMASIFSGGTFAEGALGKQTAMAKEIMDLRDQIARHEASPRGFVITDDEGRVMGEDLRIEDTKKKLQELEAEYKKLYQAAAPPAGKKTGKPDFGMSPEQIAFIKQLREQTNAVGQGPIGALFAKAEELHLGEKTRLQIQALGQAMKEEADAADTAREHIQSWTKAHAFADDLAQSTKDLELQTIFLGRNSAQLQLIAANQRIANEVRQVGIGLTDDERAAFIALTNVLGEDYITALEHNIEVSRKFKTGFRDAMNSINEDATNAAMQAKALFIDAFRGMEDALVSFVMTGKLSFRSLAESIIADLIRIQVQQSITGPLSAFFAGLAERGGTVDVLPGMVHLAGGGAVSAGMPYWVGEQGPELFVPRSSGSIVANGAGGGGNVTINQSIHIDSRSDQATILLAMSQAKDAAVAEVRKENVRRPALRS